MTLNADSGCGRGGTVSFTSRRGVNELREEDLICRAPDAGELEPCTTLYVTPTPSHRGSCPAPPGQPRSGCDGPGRSWLSAGRGSLTQKVPAVPVGRSENNAMLAGHRQLAEAAFASSIATPRRG